MLRESIFVSQMVPCALVKIMYFLGNRVPFRTLTVLRPCDDKDGREGGSELACDEAPQGAYAMCWLCSHCSSSQSSLQSILRQTQVKIRLFLFQRRVRLGLPGSPETKGCTFGTTLLVPLRQTCLIKRSWII